MMGAEQQTPKRGEYRVGCAFWLQWVLVNALSWSGLWFAAWFLIFLGGAFIDPVAAMLAVIGLVGGAIGILQWFVLRHYTRSAGKWMFVTAVGMSAGSVVSMTLSTALSEAMVSWSAIWALEGVLIGGAVGITQWLLLRKQVHRAGYWILASAAGLAVGWGAGWIIVDAQGLVHGWFDWLHPIIWIVAGVCYSVTTGTALIWLLRQPVTTADLE